MISKYLCIGRGLIKDCNSGATIVEFALVAPVFFLAFMGLIELGLMFFTYSVLEGAVAHGARVGLTGFSVGDRQTYIISEIERLSGGFLDRSRLDIDILAYNSFDNIGEPEPCISPPTPPCSGSPGINFTDVNGNGIWDDDQGKAGAGNAGNIVLYEINYAWRLFTPMMDSIIGDGSGNYMITTVATVKNEARFQ